MSNKMTNENELNVGDIIHRLQRIKNLGKTSLNSVNAAAALINEQQFRIELLESAIREFLKADDELIVGCADEQLQNLRNLMENKS